MPITKAKRRARVHPGQMVPSIKDAIAELKQARLRLRVCGCKNAADYVARALKSAEGALRHAERDDMQRAYGLYEQTGDERLRTVM